VNAGAARRRGTRGLRARRRLWAGWFASALVHGALALAVRQVHWTWATAVAESPAPLELDVVEVGASPPETVAASRPASERDVTPRSRGTGQPARSGAAVRHAGSPRAEATSPAPVGLAEAQGEATSRSAAVGPPGGPLVPGVSPGPPGASSAVPWASVAVPEAASGVGQAAPPSPGPAWLRTRPPAGVTSPSEASPDALHDFERGGPAPPGSARLSLDGLPMAARDRLAGAEPGAVAPARGPRISVDRLRAAREREEDAVANVRGGRVDPFLHDYVRDARVRFEEGARRIAAELPLDAQKTAETWVHGYAARVAEANARAAAALNSARRPSERREGDPPEPSTERRPDPFGAYAEATRLADAGAIERHVTVCLTVTPGRDTIVAVKRESRDPALDQLAREAFARTAAARPVPADAHAATACYDLRIRAFRMPPVPVFSCGLDKDGPTCAWPFKKITSVSVHLESVDYADDDHARRSLLRRPQ